MYTEDQIKEIIGSIAEAYSANKDVKDVPETYEEKFKYDQYLRNLPQLNPIYVDCIRENDRVAVHADERFPYSILRSKAPNQSAEEFAYQMGLYEPYTKSTWGKGKNKTKIIANPQNYSISGWDEEQEKYFFEDYPFYHNILSYFFDIVRERKIDYPNQVLLIRPESIPGKINEEGLFVPDQSVLIDPIAEIVDEMHTCRS